MNRDGLHAVISGYVVLNQVNHDHLSPRSPSTLNPQPRGAGVVGLILCALSLIGCRDSRNGSAVPAPVAVPVQAFEFKLEKSLAHDRTAYTQGILVDGEYFLESTGKYGNSSLRRVRIADGKVVKQVSLALTDFGEGLCKLGDRLYQLTWESQTAYVYDAESFEVLETFSYEGEGWGLCTDGRHLIMSDGSSQLVFRDPKTFAVQRRLAVSLRGRPVERLNELEWIDGKIFANVYTDDAIIMIDPATGQVTGLVDGSALTRQARKLHSGSEQLNGIAWDAAAGAIYLTGKNWPVVFKGSLVEK